MDMFWAYFASAENVAKLWALFWTCLTGFDMFWAHFGQIWGMDIFWTHYGHFKE